MKILVTGFDAFGKDTYNPSYAAVELLEDEINNVTINKLQLPTQFIEAFDTLEAELSNNDYTHVILTGQAAGRDGLSLEQYALNIMNSKGPDNANFTPNHLVINESELNALTSTFNLIEINEYLNSQNIKSSISYHAGTFVCNSTYFKLLSYIKVNNKNIDAVFIHVPIVEDQLVNHKPHTPYSTVTEISNGLSAFINYITK